MIKHTVATERYPISPPEPPLNHHRESINHCKYAVNNCTRPPVTSNTFLLSNLSLSVFRNYKVEDTTGLIYVGDSEVNEKYRRVEENGENAQNKEV